MIKTTNKKLLMLAVGLALGATGSAFAQTSSAPAESTAAAPAQAPGAGLLGANYAGLFYGYEHLDHGNGPSVAHEYGAIANKNVLSGVDVNLTFDDQRGSFQGVTSRSDELLAGLTGYAPVNAWLKPFLSAQAGVDWTQEVTQYANGVLWTTHHSRFDSVYSAGGEFQVMPALVVTPFAQYQEVHRLGHDWNYGIKATYRLAANWSVSLTPQIDQHHNLDYRGGINYHF